MSVICMHRCDKATYILTKKQSLLAHLRILLVIMAVMAWVSFIGPLQSYKATP